MKKYCFLSEFLVDANERELLFYTYGAPDGTETTTMWKYEMSSKECRIAFALNQRVKIWNYMGKSVNEGLQYIGIGIASSSLVMGLDADGVVIFEYETGGFCKEPLYDMSGNIYLVVNDVWIHCINRTGELQWKWRPVSPDNTSRSSRIKKYWIFNGKLYVVAGGLEYVVNLEGDTVNIYMFPSYNEAAKYVVQKDKLFYTSEDYRELLCDNFDAERLWKYCVQEDEVITQIITGEENQIFLRVRKRTSNSYLLYVIDQNGNLQWKTIQKWSQLYNISDNKIMLTNGKNVAIYHNDGREIFQYSGKEDVLWGKVIAKELIMIAEQRGNIVVIERSEDFRDVACVSEISTKRKADESLSPRQLLRWQKELSEYLMLNMEIWLRYYHIDIQEIALSYEMFKSLSIQVLSVDGKWLEGMANSIPYEMRVESDGDLFRECSCREDIVWLEFCSECPEKQMKIVLEKVCETMYECLNVPAYLKVV